MVFTINIPMLDKHEEIRIEAGSSAVFVGANGTGKTRLATYIEEQLGINAHRISAHRALTLNPTVPKISEANALLGLRVGYSGENAAIHHRAGSRWGGKNSVHMLNDFDFLIQALFAEQSNRALTTHRKVRSGDNSSADPTKFEVLTEIWEQLLPHRKLHVSGDDIQVSDADADADQYYSGSEMSDGERAVFYMLGQTLVAVENSLIIFDEPELHIHRSIMAKLWDAVESVRPDCAFLFITHDLEFASSRVADKYVLRQYSFDKSSPYWNIEKLPSDSGFDEELTTLILGSRKPILFVEGTNDSLDIALYRSCFTEWSIVPKGSCEDVIHSVVTMRKNASLTRITCSGIVDADDYSQADRDHLQSLGIATLPVSEIENLILLPSVSSVIAQSEGHVGSEIDAKLENLASDIFASLNSDKAIEKVVTRYCKRRIDRLLKKIDFAEAETVDALSDLYSYQTAQLNIESIAQEATDRIRQAVESRDLPLLLANYDNKGLIASAALHLKGCRRNDFESWIVRVLKNDSVEGLVQSIKDTLPDITPQ
ncbi:AAA family ATPase [Psychrobacter sp. P11G5]|uniref:AAA family ATPase n=1 Tax=Psychrobacter sp. P11G5 TaxID=1699624 RepID=UPI00078EEEFA|nr:AAA family ATPase [Psychrobacter sp. P11G5]AMN69052.1 ABC transporter ATP-binding protein [Psychrobacter sp. P11G5]